MSRPRKLPGTLTTPSASEEQANDPKCSDIASASSTNSNSSTPKSTASENHAQGCGDHPPAPESQKFSVKKSVLLKRNGHPKANFKRHWAEATAPCQAAQLPTLSGAAAARAAGMSAGLVSNSRSRSQSLVRSSWEAAPSISWESAPPSRLARWSAR